MLSLQNSEKFKKEYNFYKNKIEKITNSEAKEKAINLLSELKSYIIIIDEGHHVRNNRSLNPKGLRDNIFKLVDIRKSLNQLIKDAGV